MKVYHVIVEKDGSWYCARAMEDPAVFTQGKSFDEIIGNIREVAELMYGEKEVQIELIVPPRVSPSRKRTAPARIREGVK
jgi:predicted RNase H-like HicB family nuclease